MSKYSREHKDRGYKYYIKVLVEIMNTVGITEISHLRGKRFLLNQD